MGESTVKVLGWTLIFLWIASLGVAMAGNQIATAIVICGWLYLITHAFDQPLSRKEDQNGR